MVRNFLTTPHHCNYSSNQTKQYDTLSFWTHEKARRRYVVFSVAARQVYRQVYTLSPTFGLVQTAAPSNLRSRASSMNESKNNPCVFNKTLFL